MHIVSKKVYQVVVGIAPLTARRIKELRKFRPSNLTHISLESTKELVWEFEDEDESTEFLEKVKERFKSKPSDVDRTGISSGSSIVGSFAWLKDGRIGKVKRRYRSSSATGIAEWFIVVRFSKNKVATVLASNVREYRFDLGG